MLVRSGSYQGTGAALSVTGLGFQPDALVIKAATTAGVAHLITNTMAPGNAKPISGATALQTGLITSLNADGFTLDTGAALNTNGVTYHWFALKNATGNCATTTYTGTGAGQTIAGLGFQADVLFISSAGAAATNVKFSTAAADSVQTLGGADAAGQVTSLTSDGFVLSGSNVNTNANGTVYHVLALKAQAGVCAVIPTYTGNGTSQSITGAGFAPAVAFVKGSGVTTAIARYKAETGANSLPVTASAENTTSITALGADGFSVGSSANVNTGAATYRAFALAETPRSGALLLLGVG